MSNNGLTRRMTLVSMSLGTAGAALLGCGESEPQPPGDPPTPTPSDDDDSSGNATDCVETGSQVEGPYYPGEPPELLDISGDRVGVPLQVEFQVVDLKTNCTPLSGAEVDLWHADASGDYSGYAAFGTVGEDWLRGQQITDEDGWAQFQTVFPGSYPGRSAHLHLKVRADGFGELTTQVYFPDSLVAKILARPDYDGAPMTTLAADNFYSPETMMESQGNAKSGVVASIVIGLVA